MLRAPQDPEALITSDLGQADIDVKMLPRNNFPRIERVGE
jgi:hypothetical protein